MPTGGESGKVAFSCEGVAVKTTSCVGVLVGMSVAGAVVTTTGGSTGEAVGISVLGGGASVGTAVGVNSGGCVVIGDKSTNGVGKIGSGVGDSSARADRAPQIATSKKKLLASSTRAR